MEVDAPREPLFRPVKRRKFLRKRPDSGEPDEPVSPSTAQQKPERNGDDTTGNGVSQKGKGRSTTSPQDEGEEEEEEDTGSTFAEIMRLRKPYRGRKAGIEFSTDSSKSRSRMGGGDGDLASAGALAAQEDIEAERLQAISNRFTPHSGQKVDVDKHMYVSFLFPRDISLRVFRTRTWKIS